MAGETRRERRDARRALGEEVAAAARQETQRGHGAAELAVAGAPPAAGRRFSFVHESVAELKKVEWPNRAQVIQGTIVVIIACAVVGVFLWAADLGLKPFVRDVLLNS
jgi:preprotein translocase subunit SecE